MNEQEGHGVEAATEEQIVMIVDDNPTNLGVIADYLEEHSLRILVSRDGEGALEKLKRITPDIILLDVMMPGIDGFETCHRLKEHEATKDIPVIFMTALANPEDKVRGFEVGGVDYVTKPLHQEEVLARVTTHLRIQKLQRTTQQQNEQLRHEIAEREKAEQELRKAHEEIVRLEKTTLERQMAGGFAHEMRNALSGSKMLLERIGGTDSSLCCQTADILGVLFDSIEPLIPPEKRGEVLEYFQKIEQNTQELDRVLNLSLLTIRRAMHVTNLILEYSRLGRTTPGNEQISLKDVILSVLQEQQHTIETAHITLRTELAETLPLTGHESHFHSIVSNMVLNACDALTECDDERERLLSIELAEQKDRQTLRIRDTANGIAQDDLQHIFEPFYSTKPSTGVGLGLNFVAKLVDIYQGTIRVEGEVGSGTTFIITLPCTKKPERS